MPLPTLPTLSIYDPISGGFVNIDGGAKSNSVLFYSILVELRTATALLQQLVDSSTDDVRNLRADQSVAEPQFANVR